MTDVMETIGSSLIQHGLGNDRAYLIKLHPDDAPEMAGRLEELATSRGYSKIFAKVPGREADRFERAGYGREAAIPGFYPEGDSVFFMSRYFSAERSRERQPLLVREVLAAAETKKPADVPAQLPAGYAIRPAGEADAVEMAAVYSTVFASYPFPIDDPAFLRKTMEESTVYFGVWHGKSLVALSSAEIDYPTGSAEMTDFATLPAFQGHGFALHLLQKMEEAMRQSGIRSLFTIARAYSFGMNITFARNGYRFGGTLTNNTNIFGSLESMNVWHKRLDS